MNWNNGYNRYMIRISGDVESFSISSLILEVTYVLSKKNAV